MAQQIVKVKGLYTYPSEISEVPDGALYQADDVVIDRDSVVESRTGFNNYAAISGTGTDRSKQLLEFQSHLLTHFNSSLISDSVGTETSISGTYDPPSHGDSYVPKIRSAALNSNLYFTSNTGLKKLDAIGNSVVSAGAPQGLDVSVAITATGSTSAGFCTNNNQVAYRIVWGYTDANNNLILGAPSMRVVFTNSSGGNSDLDVTFSVPSSTTTSYVFQIYRSALSGGVAIAPNDELGLVYTRTVTSAEIAAKLVTVTDNTPDSLRGASLYTNASQQGITQANNQPPSFKDVAAFKNCLFGANTLSKQNLYLTLLSVSTSSAGTGVTFVSTTGNTTSGSKTVSSLGTTTGLAAGQTVSGTGIANGTTIASVDSSTQVTLSANATATNVGTTLQFYDVLTIGGVNYLAAASEDATTQKFKVTTTGTAAQNIDATAQSLVRVINRTSVNTTLYAYYLSGANDLPGKIYLEARSLGASTFYATASAHASAWNPQLPTSGTTVLSSNNQYQNQLYFSKTQTPEAFPTLNYVFVGSASSPILRIIPLRESLMILKSEGVYRLTGDSPTNFTVDLLDNTVNLLAPETAVKLNNQIFAFTNQGAVTITDTGVGVISRPIEDKLLPLITLSHFATSSFAVAYETKRRYILCLPTASSDTTSTQQFVWNTFTSTWTRWTKNVTCGLVASADDKLYFGSATSNQILQERKNSLYTDYSDEDYAVTITGVSGTKVTLSSVASVNIGDGLVQGSLPFSLVTAVDSTMNTITLDVAYGWTNGSATMKTRINSVVKWAPQYFSNPGMMKHVRELTLFVKDNRFSTASLTFSSNLVKSSSSVTISGFRSSAWGYFAWGSIPWGTTTDVEKHRTYLPTDYQRCTYLNLTFTHANAFGRFAIDALSYIFNPMSERSSQ